MVYDARAFRYLAKYPAIYMGERFFENSRGRKYSRQLILLRDLLIFSEKFNFQLRFNHAAHNMERNFRREEKSFLP